MNDYRIIELKLTRGHSQHTGQGHVEATENLFFASKLNVTFIPKPIFGMLSALVQGKCLLI